MRKGFILLIIAVFLIFNVGSYVSFAEGPTESNEEEKSLIVNSDEGEMEENPFEGSMVQDLRAVATSPATIDLSWSAIEGATNYEIYQASGPNAEYTLIDTVSSISYTLQNVTPGPVKYYKIRGVQETNEMYLYSQYSQIVSAATSLTAPLNLETAKTTYNSVTLSWSQVIGAKGYEIYAAESANGTFKRVKITSDTTFTHTNLATNKSYFYKIKAYSQDITTYYGPFSNTISAKLSFTAPVNLKVTNKTYNSVSLSWSKVQDAKGYEIWMASAKDGKYTKVISTTSTSYTHKNLATNKTYYHKIRAYTGNPTVYTSYSGAVSSKLSLASPQNFKVAKKTYNSVSLSWSKVQDAKGYEIWMASSKDGKYTKVTSTTSTSYTHKNLATNKTYYYKIRAYTAGSPTVYSSYSGAVSAKLSLASPQNFKIAKKTYNSVSLSWSTVQDAKGYEIWMATSKDGKYTKVTSTTSTSYIHKNLTTNKTYYYKIRSYAGSKPVYSSYSSIVSAKLFVPAPSSLKVSTKTYDSLTLLWGKANEAKGYEVYMSTTKNGKYTKVKSTESTSFKHTKLTTNKTYYYKVRSYVKSGKKTYYSSFTSKVKGKPTLNAVPSVKTSGHVDAIKISWGSVSGANEYRVYRSSSKNGDYKVVKSTTDKSYTDKSVKKRVTYYYKIAAIRKVGKNTYAGPASTITSGITRTVEKPNFSVWTSSETDSSTYAVLLHIENYGSKPLRILSDGALIDNEYEDFDRPLQQIDVDTIEDLEWLEIGAKSDSFIGYRVIGGPTWYDRKSTIIYEFKYDGIEYYGYASSYYGSYYSEKKK
ncbi:hypothetical protein AC622_00055 [Bacillus sp. FJAT-27916]|uniref:fibronectin type III domain-containing protein n=1 Tax=Bacillus sp. FJAT-27916 TaxID=1679169 RepID=UPI0006710E21|nr:fibronectin type III domain-containing protein [Bacillus sp. FJAT-27916]KMY42847.1 hypothetical protein AC622_00055 [Bacillus sp. FJAT-27916]